MRANRKWKQRPGHSKCLHQKEIKTTFFPYRCSTWCSPTWRCVFLSMCHTCSTLLWERVAGSTSTCSRSCGSHLCTTRLFCGRTASAAHRRPSCRVSGARGQIALAVAPLFKLLSRSQNYGGWEGQNQYDKMWNNFTKSGTHLQFGNTFDFIITQNCIKS